MPNVTRADCLDRVRDILPSTTDETELSEAARMLAASLNAEVHYMPALLDGEPVGTDGDTGSESAKNAGSLSAYDDSPLAIRSRRVELTEAEIAQRAAFTIAPWHLDENGEPYATEYRNRGEDVPTVTAAPDDYTGVRAEVVATRSAKGRTGTIVRKHGTPAVAGSLTLEVRPNTVAVGPTVRRTASQCAVPFHHATGATASVVGHLVASVVDRDARHLTSGRLSGIDVSKLTDSAYGPLGLPAMIGTEARGYAEVTPEMFDFAPIGVAVHRSDMSGQSGILALTATQQTHELARWADRNSLPRPTRYRNADTLRTVRTLCDLDGVTDTPASETFAVAALPAPDIANRPRTILRQQGRTVRTVQIPDTRERIWQGHNLIERLPDDVSISHKSKGTQATSIGKLPHGSQPTTIAGWETLADSLNRGERVTGTSDTGTWTLSRTAKKGHWSGTATDSQGTTAKFAGMRTATGTATKLHNLTL